MICEADHRISEMNPSLTDNVFLVDMDVSVPDEILRHCGGLLLSFEDTGPSGEDREEGAGLQPHHGGLW